MTAGGCTASPAGPGSRDTRSGRRGNWNHPVRHGSYGNRRGMGQRTSDRISVPGAGPWNLVDGWLRVEYQNAAGAWVGITNEWLQLGFARGLVSPTKPVGGGAGSNPVHPNAILIFQQLADRDAVCPAATVAPPTHPATFSTAALFQLFRGTAGTRSTSTIHARVSRATRPRRAWPILLAMSTAS